MDKFVLENVFNRLEPDDMEPVWWRETFDHDGYIMVWDDGERLHTYRHPLDWYGVL